MANRLRRQRLRKLAMVGYVLGIAIVILLLPTRLTSPARTIFTQLIGPAEDVAFHAGGDTLAAAGTLREALLGRERDRSLEQEVIRLGNEKVQLQDLQLLQKLRLRSIRGLSVEGFPCRVLSTVVTAYDSVLAHQSITIASGTTDGVREGQVVCSAGAVVGRVVEAGRWRSRVRLITDAASSLPCRVSRTRSLCILRGTSGANCRVEWIDRDASIERGDVLLTAPVDEVVSQRPLIPPGLPAATIVQVERHRTDPFFLNVIAAPRVGLQRLEVVEVVIPTPPAPPEE